MPSLTKEFILDLKNPSNQNIFDKYPTFVESGTYMGETIFTMEKYFKNLHTIEIKKEFYEQVKSMYKGKKIKFYLGDSSNMLKNVINNINENAVFFLDGHWSAGKTGKGAKDCPLVEELEIIIKNFKYDAIIIIDDFRLFGKGPTKKTEICNWEEINKDNLINIVKNRLEMEYHLPSELNLKDRLIFHIKS